MSSIPTSQPTSPPASQPSSPGLGRWAVTILVAATAWVAAYTHLTDFADVVVGLLGLARGTHAAEAVHFFIYDTPKVLLLLVAVVGGLLMWRMRRR